MKIIVSYSEKPLRYEYRLTEKGRSFYPVVCLKCGTQVERKDLDASLSSQFAKERVERRAAFKRK